MQELLRTTDRVLLSWVTARLAGAGLGFVVFDPPVPAPEGGIAALPYRVEVADGDLGTAQRLVAVAAPADSGLSRDQLLGGRLLLRQPRRGYRVAIDAVLLAAAVAARPGERVLELGTGVGAAALCLAARLPGVAVVGLELQGPLAALAAQNIAANGLEARVRVVTGDLGCPPSALVPGSFDRVMANPPYLRAGTHTPSPEPSRAAANGEGTAGLGDWIAAAAAMLRPKGTLTLIHRADRLDEVISLLHKEFGALVVFPLWPRAGAAARRVLLSARLGVASPARLAPGLTLHGPGSGFTAGAEAVLRDGCGLEL
ncbi:MAG: methyltransferase [Rhodospirillaceae bacterium]